MIGDGLAKYLQLKLGDTLILLGQGYHGSTAAGQYPIQGIFHFPLEQMNNTLVYLYLPDAQSLFGAPGRLTSISIMLRQPDDIDATTRFLEQSLDSTREVMQWPAMNKSLVQEIQGDNAGGIIMLGILYMVVAFGVFGTILMMTIGKKKRICCHDCNRHASCKVNRYSYTGNNSDWVNGDTFGKCFNITCSCIPASLSDIFNRINCTNLPAVRY